MTRVDRAAHADTYCNDRTNERRRTNLAAYGNAGRRGLRDEADDAEGL